MYKQISLSTLAAVLACACVALADSGVSNVSINGCDVSVDKLVDLIVKRADEHKLGVVSPKKAAIPNACSLGNIESQLDDSIAKAIKKVTISFADDQEPILSSPAAEQEELAPALVDPSALPLKDRIRLFEGAQDGKVATVAPAIASRITKVQKNFEDDAKVQLSDFKREYQFEEELGLPQPEVAAPAAVQEPKPAPESVSAPAPVPLPALRGVPVSLVRPPSVEPSIFQTKPAHQYKASVELPVRSVPNQVIPERRPYDYVHPDPRPVSALSGGLQSTREQYIKHNYSQPAPIASLPASPPASKLHGNLPVFPRGAYQPHLTRAQIP